MTLPSGLASISSQFDDSPQVRGAVDVARRLRLAEALTLLPEMDAPHIGGDPFPGSVSDAIDRHAALVIGSAYRSADRR